MDKIECEFDPLIFNTTFCRVNLIDRYTQTLTTSAYLFVPQHNVRMHIIVFYRFRVYRKFLVEFDVNLCDVSNTDKSSTHPILVFALPYIRQYSTYDFECPFHGNITIDRLKVDNRFVRNSIIPSGQYRVNVRVYNPQTNRTQIDTKIYFTVPPSRDAHVDQSMG